MIRRALVVGAGGEVGRATVAALTAEGVTVVAARRERDATDPVQVAALLTAADPDLVVVTAGARPRMAPLDEQTWARSRHRGRSTSGSPSRWDAPPWPPRCGRVRPS